MSAIDDEEVVIDLNERFAVSVERISTIKHEGLAVPVMSLSACILPDPATKNRSARKSGYKRSARKAPMMIMVTGPSVFWMSGLA